MRGIKDLYGVLKGKVINYRDEAKKDPVSPHAYITVMVNDLEYEIAVNMKSAPKNPIIINEKEVPNELLYIADANFDAKQITNLQGLNFGFYPIKYQNKYIYSKSDYPANLNINYPSNKYSPENIAIDFIRSKLFDPCEMIILPPDKSGDINDLSEFLRMHIGENARSKKATIYVFGGHYSDEKGIHEVHMNQGSIGEFVCSNGVYQDGCILLEYPDGHWEGIFLAFQSQSWDTNDKTGTAESNSFIYDHTNRKKICKIH